MLLSVIVPDDRPGMQRMLANELQFIDSEVIYDTWRSGLEKAQGDFVCLLERDSGISRGALTRQLAEFVQNPRFRKLAMVSPLVEFDDTEPMSLSTTNDSREPHLSRTGSLGGAIIRRTSLMRFEDCLRHHIVEASYMISTSFWETGLRVMTDPNSVYYSPKKMRRGTVTNVSAPLLELWKRECIA